MNEISAAPAIGAAATARMRIELVREPPELWTSCCAGRVAVVASAHRRRPRFGVETGEFGHGDMGNAADRVMDATSSERSRAAIDVPELAVLWRDDLDIYAGPAGRIGVLYLAGDIDALTLPLVCAALVTALETRPAHLVVDLSEVRFCGVRGFILLAATARAAASNGIGYAVTGMGPHLDRAAAQIWSDQPIVRCPTIAAAITAIHHDHPGAFLECAAIAHDRSPVEVVAGHVRVQR